MYIIYACTRYVYDWVDIFFISSVTIFSLSHTYVTFMRYNLHEIRREQMRIIIITFGGMVLSSINNSPNAD